MRGKKVISDDPPPEQLEEMLAQLTEPPQGVVDELRDELARGQEAHPPAEWPPFLQELRDKMDVRYAGPPTSDRPLVGPALILAKRIFRWVGQPFINEALRKQVEFNQAMVTAALQLHENLQQQGRNQALWREEIEARLADVEQKARGRTSEKPRRPR
jgi:hypothetical protein